MNGTKDIIAREANVFFWIYLAPAAAVCLTLRYWDAIRLWWGPM